MKLFSIIIPSYNSDEKLTRCINSFKHLLDDDRLEFIVIDDASRISQKKFIKQFQNIKYFKNNNNVGLAISRNIGAEKAIGKFIIFIDSDDEILVDEFEKIFNLVSIDSNYDLIRVGIIENNVKLQFHKIKNFNNLNKYLFYTFFIVRYTTIVSPTHIYSRKFFLNFPFPNERIYSEDFFHFVLCTEKVKKILVTNINYYIYNKDNEHSITKTKQKEIQRDQLKIYNFSFQNIGNSILYIILFIFFRLNFCRGKKNKLKINKIKLFKNVLFFILMIPWIII